MRCRIDSYIGNRCGYAASIILDQFNDPADKAKWFIERFKSVIESLKRSSQVATPAEHTFLKSSRPEEA